MENKLERRCPSVTFLYAASDNSQERRHSHQWGGLASCEILFVPESIGEEVNSLLPRALYLNEPDASDDDDSDENNEEEVFEDSGNEEKWSEVIESDSE